MLVDKHLMGRDILDIDGRRVEAVNDVHLLESKGRLALVHVDTSFNGFLRRWGLRWLHLGGDRLISWRFVQPLNVEDAVRTDRLSLSVTRDQIQELPSEDLADALEELSGSEQEALFSALEPDRAAQALVEAEARAQRQIMARLPRAKAARILGELSVPQIADLLSALPHDRALEIMPLLPAEKADRIAAIVDRRDVTAEALASRDFYATREDRTVGVVLGDLRRSGSEPHAISYVFVTGGEQQLVGVIDLRELVLAPDGAVLADIMTSPVIASKATELREDLENVFHKYHFRMLPVVDGSDRLLGVIHYGDIVKGAAGARS